MAPEYKRDMASVGMLVQLASEYGMSAIDCLKGTGLKAADLGNPLAEIRVEQELAVIRRVQAQLGDDKGLGILAGLRHSLGMRGMLGFAVLSSASVREALELVLRYIDLNYSYCSIVLEEGEQQCVAQIDTDVPTDVRRFIVERTFGAALALCREVTHNLTLITRLEFAFPRPAYAKLFEPLSQESTRFRAKHNCIVVDRAVLDLPLPGANLLTQQLCLEQCQKLLQARRIRTGVAELVRDNLLREPDNMSGIETIAKKLAMSASTLRRRLGEEDTSYRELVDEIRLTLAAELLSTGMSVERIADRLGFAEASSFIRAYKRWAGVTPGNALPRITSSLSSPKRKKSN